MEQVNTSASNGKKAKVVEVAPKEGRTVHSATHVDVCHFKNSELDKKFRKYKGRIVLLRDAALKDDPGSHAISIEKGSSASHVIAATVFEVISRLSGCTSDSVSAYTQMKRRRSKTNENTRSECPVIWTRLLRSRCPKIMGPLCQIPRYHWRESCTDTPWLDYCGGENSKKAY